MTDQVLLIVDWTIRVEVMDAVDTAWLSGKWYSDSFQSCIELSKQVIEELQTDSVEKIRKVMCVGKGER